MLMSQLTVRIYIKLYISVPKLVCHAYKAGNHHSCDSYCVSSANYKLCSANGYIIDNTLMKAGLKISIDMASGFPSSVGAFHCFKKPLGNFSKEKVCSPSWETLSERLLFSQ